MRNKTVYMGSLWHEDCDPFISVAGFDQKEVQKRLDTIAEEEYQTILDQCDCEECEDHQPSCDAVDDCECPCCDDDIMTSGVHPETLQLLWENVDERAKRRELLEGKIIVF